MANDQAMRAAPTKNDANGIVYFQYLTVSGLQPPFLEQVNQTKKKKER